MKNINLKKLGFFKNCLFILVISTFILSCKGPDGKFKVPGSDARKFPADPKLRVKKNLEEGRGFKLNNVFDGPKGGVFDFASSNELWRASLDTIDFMPLLSVNYSGGIIVTDWYSSEESLSGESVKISIRFLTNEIRSDALDIKVFNRKCNNVSNCIINQVNDELAPELTKQILKKATLYKQEAKEKDNKKID
tara:strand:+ start:88 stop:666 length:579 start_codon:yes stop_codon:yes gene_type:complete